MAIESAQLLYTAHWVLDTGSSPTGPAGSRPYKQTHANHPCSKWVRQSNANYNWLSEHALGIIDEYSLRYGKSHACAPHIKWLRANQPRNIPTNDVLTAFAMAFYAKDQAKYKACFVPLDPVQSYRNYYKMDKARFAKWKYTRNPYWW